MERSIEIIATAREAEDHPRLGKVHALDVARYEEAKAIIERYLPTHVINLAGNAATARANADVRQTWRVHLEGVLALSQAIMERAPDCTLVNVGTGLVYGATAAKVSPLTEEAILDPLDDYAATKAAADLALGALARRGLKCVRLRPFNHTGAGQSTNFAVPAFAMQIARIEAGLTLPVVRVGNLDAERDFLDVRDVATSYALVTARSDRLSPGTILNIASGIPKRMADVLDTLLEMSPTPIKIERDTRRLRANELQRIVGDASRAHALVGWRPQHDMRDTLHAVLAECRALVGRAQ
jgi:GDP-4-dehydro-6-deoxy-D-mannose reductase